MTNGLVLFGYNSHPMSPSARGLPPSRTYVRTPRRSHIIVGANVGREGYEMVILLAVNV